MKPTIPQSIVSASLSVYLMFSCQTIYAEPLTAAKELSELLSASRRWSQGASLELNEIALQEMLYVTSEAPAGFVLSTHAEKGLIALAINPQLYGLTLVHENPLVILYNKMNVALLQLSQNLNHYQELRKILFYGDLLKATSTLEAVSKRMDAKGLDLLLLRSLRQHLTYDVLDSHEIPEFVNYVKNDVLFQRLKMFAESGRILSRQMDLRDELQLRDFVQNFPIGRRLSLIDLSNTWWPSQIGIQGTQDLLRTIRTISELDAMVLLKDSSRRLRQRWDYFGIPLKDFLFGGMVRSFLSIWQRDESKPTELLRKIRDRQIVKIHQRIFYREPTAIPQCRPLFFKSPSLRHE